MESPEKVRKYLGNSRRLPSLYWPRPCATCSPMHGPGGSGRAPRGEIRFAPYLLDLDAGLLRSGETAISRRPKTWAVLCYLAHRPGVPGPKEGIPDAAWPGTAVTEPRPT